METLPIGNITMETDYQYIEYARAQVQVPDVVDAYMLLAHLSCSPTV